MSLLRLIRHISRLPKYMFFILSLLKILYHCHSLYEASGIFTKLDKQQYYQKSSLYLFKKFNGIINNID